MGNINYSNRGCFTIGNDQTYECTGTLICGKNRQELMDRLCELLKSRGVELIKPTTLEELNSISTDLYNLMMSRFRQMEKEQVNSAYKLKEGIQPRCVIISDFNEMFTSGDSKLIEDTRTKISSVVRLAKATGLYVFVCCDEYKPSILHVDLVNNLINKFYVDTVSNEEDIYFLDMKHHSKTIPDGCTLCISGSTILQGKIKDIK